MASAWVTHPGVRPPAWAAGATRPDARRFCLSRRTQDALTRYLVATARVAVPASQSARTRSRKSIEYARMGVPVGDTTLHEPINPR
jgi:hypothetical protein